MCRNQVSLTSTAASLLIHTFSTNLEIQKIRDPRFPSFNVFGLCCILTVSFIIISLDWCLPSLVGYFHKRARKNLIDEEAARKRNGNATQPENSTTEQQAPNPKPLKYAEWNATSTLQLQRMAHEAIGSGTWSRTSTEVPVTLPGQRLAMLGFKEPPASHPYLVMPDAGDSADGDEEPKPAEASNTSSVETATAQDSIEAHAEQSSEEQIEIMPLPPADTADAETEAVESYAEQMSDEGQIETMPSPLADTVNAESRGDEGPMARV
jgi:hypothetical protein